MTQQTPKEKAIIQTEIDNISCDYPDECIHIKNKIKEIREWIKTKKSYEGYYINLDDLEEFDKEFGLK